MTEATLHFEPVVPPADENHPALLYLATLSPQSRRALRNALDAVATVASDGEASAMTFPWAELRQEHTARIRATLLQRYKPASVNQFLTALRGVLKQCFRLGQMSLEAYTWAVDITNVRTEGRRKFVSTNDLHRLFDAVDRDRSAFGRRDAALLAVLYGAGLRCSEAASLRMGDYSDGSLSTTGRGLEARTLPLGVAISTRLDAWIDVRGPRSGPLFNRLTRSGRVIYEKLTRQMLFRICRKRAEAAGIDAFSPKDLRNRFLRDLVAAGADDISVLRLAGCVAARRLRFD